MRVVDGLSASSSMGAVALGAASTDRVALDPGLVSVILGLIGLAPHILAFLKDRRKPRPRAKKEDRDAD